MNIDTKELIANGLIEKFKLILEKYEVELSDEKSLWDHLLIFLKGNTSKPEKSDTIDIELGRADHDKFESIFYLRRKLDSELNQYKLYFVYKIKHGDGFWQNILKKDFGLGIENKETEVFCDEISIENFIIDHKN